jgi:hypothetical protein
MKAGAHAEAVSQIQYFIQQVPQATLVTMMKEMPKEKIIKIFSALPLAWKAANELSAAESKTLVDAFVEILLKLLTIGLGSS